MGTWQQSACPCLILQLQAEALQPDTQGCAPDKEQGRSLSATEDAGATSEDVWATEG